MTTPIAPPNSISPRSSSELMFLTGCLGIYGETNPTRIRAAIELRGGEKECWHAPVKDKAKRTDSFAAVYQRVFGTPCA